MVNLHPFLSSNVAIRRESSTHRKSRENNEFCSRLMSSKFNFDKVTSKNNIRQVYLNFDQITGDGSGREFTGRQSIINGAKSQVGPFEEKKSNLT